MGLQIINEKIKYLAIYIIFFNLREIKKYAFLILFYFLNIFSDFIKNKNKITNKNNIKIDRKYYFPFSIKKCL